MQQLKNRCAYSAKGNGMNQFSTLDSGIIADLEQDSLGKHRFRVFTQRDLERIKYVRALSSDLQADMRVVSSVLPFRVNNYVVEELINWSNVPDDPIYQLTFPQREMLSPHHYQRIAEVYRHGGDNPTIEAIANEIRAELNPHPAGQLNMNVPRDDDGRLLHGLQHKYRETVLFFPSQGQTCHSYCTFCFRWAQFIGDKSLRMASTEVDRLVAYLRSHREVSDILITGGDPMVMKTRHLEGYLNSLLGPGLDHIKTVRIGTKALTFWPQRFVTDDDAEELLDCLERLVKVGKHVAIMAHYNHWRELNTEIAIEAIRRLRATGVEIRSQGPLLAHVNDNAEDWARLWQTQVQLGIIPYYMFIERDTGARRYFQVPLAKAWTIYREAMLRVSGLGRTARGPSMSAAPGKVEVQGVADIRGEKVFVLRFIQGRNPDWVQRPFFAVYDEQATWLDDLKPAFGEKEFFFEAEYREMQRARNC